MNIKTHLKLFLSSSSELSEERTQFELFINRNNEKLVKKGIYIELVIWENFDDSISSTRLQDEYNEAIRKCDIFVLLFYSKVGFFTKEEFIIALNEFKETGRPIIYTYFKETNINTKDISVEIISMLKFKEFLKEIGHFYTSYENIEGLLFHFSKQLEKILENRAIAEPIDDFKQTDIDATTGWVELNKHNFSVQNKETLNLFYNGLPPSWSIIKDGTFERDTYRKILNYFRDGNWIALIKGAGGEGKSTLMMQVGMYYFENKHQVFYVNSHLVDLEVLRKKIGKKQTLILIDEADQVDGLYEFINSLKIFSNLKILMTSRSNEWNYFLNKNPKAGLIKRIIGESGKFDLKALSNVEIEKLIKLLLKNGVISENKGKEWKQDLKNESKRFLLAAMLKATKGKRLELIIEDVLIKISNWEDGFLALKALGIIVSLEVKKNKKGASLYCTNRLLQTGLRKVEKISDKKYFKIKQYLFQEAFIQDNQNRQTTRNEIISELFYKYLFKNPELNLLSEQDVNFNILYASVLIDNDYSKDLIVSIPRNYNTKNDALILSEIFKNIYDFGALKSGYSTWAKVEAQLGNLGDYNKKYSTKWIYKIALDRGINDHGLYLTFAKFEEKQGNIGSFDIEYSARWIFRRALEISNYHGLYLAFAKFEERQGNVGDYETEYSAKWLLKKATDISQTDFLDYEF